LHNTSKSVAIALPAALLVVATTIDSAADHYNDP
jgi:hypothetical protein